MTGFAAEGMEDPCLACGRVVGDHTMREFNACTGESGYEIAYAPASSRTINERFGIPSGVLVADHVIAKASVVEGAAGALKIKLAGLLLEFASSATGRVEPVTKVLVMGDAPTIRSVGRLVRDTANGAANATERR